jgi:predicted metal-dependent phosphotriesterase family hydrolase
MRNQLKLKSNHLPRCMSLAWVCVVSILIPALFSCKGKASISEKPIPTVTGEILPSQMGLTSVHEHIQLDFPAEQREKSMSFAIEELKKAKASGINTIITVGPNRDVAGIKEVALASGMNIVCCTGFYVLQDDQMNMSVEDFENHMVAEIEGGIQGTGIYPGVIKVATKALPFKQAERNALIAAAHVQKKYKLPICTHAVSGCAEQQQILEEAGADLNHVYFSHVEAAFGWSGRNVDQEIDYLEQVVKKGSTLSFNNFGNWNHTKPEDLIKIISQLVKRGYDDHMVATMDLTWSFENDSLKILWGDTNEGGEDRTYSYLTRKAIPWMRENGIPEKSINKFVVDNPKRLFSEMRNDYK